MSFSSHTNYQEKFMLAAIEEAQKAVIADEVPIGAVVVLDGNIIARSHNLPITLTDPTAHAEILALRQAAQFLGNYRLNHCDLYVTLEPCPMCLGAMLYARVRNLYFGAYDQKLGAVESVYQLLESPKINHQIVAQGGYCADACKEILQTFFQTKRQR